jgi:hypothetical protein
VASALGLCPHFSVEDYYFPVDDVQQPEMFANAELDSPETFCDTKLVPLWQHHLVTYLSIWMTSLRVQSCVVSCCFRCVII